MFAFDILQERKEEKEEEKLNKKEKLETIFLSKEEPADYPLILLSDIMLGWVRKK